MYEKIFEDCCFFPCDWRDHYVFLLNNGYAHFDKINENYATEPVLVFALAIRKYCVKFSIQL